MTQNAIRTAVKNSGMSVGMIAVVEQCLLARNFFAKDSKLLTTKQKEKGVKGKTLYYKTEFNYNWCLNLGFSVCTSRYTAFCNNDLLFESGWAKNAVEAMQKGGYLSASPTPRHIFKGVHEGYKIGKQLLGWCIITDREVFERIGRFDEAVTFWYSDDVYADQLKRAGIKHILVGNSRVKHLGSVTLRKIAAKKRVKYMRKERIPFDKYRHGKAL